MKTVYRAENVIDASLIRDLLDQAEILAFVNGGFLQGGMGELPVAGLVTVTVADEDYPLARSIIEAFEADRHPLVEEPDAATAPRRSKDGPLPEGSS